MENVIKTRDKNPNYKKLYDYSEIVGKMNLWESTEIQYFFDC